MVCLEQISNDLVGHVVFAVGQPLVFATDEPLRFSVGVGALLLPCELSLETAQALRFFHLRLIAAAIGGDNGILEAEIDADNSLNRVRQRRFGRKVSAQMVLLLRTSSVVMLWML